MKLYWITIWIILGNDNNNNNIKINDLKSTGILNIKEYTESDLS